MKYPQGSQQPREACDYVAVVTGCGFQSMNLQSLTVVTLGGTLKLGLAKLEITQEDEPLEWLQNILEKEGSSQKNQYVKSLPSNTRVLWDCVEGIGLESSTSTKTEAQRGWAGSVTLKWDQ